MSRRERLEHFGAAAVSGFRVARNRSRAGLDDSELRRVQRDCRAEGLHPRAAEIGALYAAGFRVGWLSGWGT